MFYLHLSQCFQAGKRLKPPGPARSEVRGRCPLLVTLLLLRQVVDAPGAGGVLQHNKWKNPSLV